MFLDPWKINFWIVSFVCNRILPKFLSISSFKEINVCGSTRLPPYWFYVFFNTVFSSPKASRAGYGILIIVIYWVTEVCPLAVTSTLPLIIFPLLGVLSSSSVAAAYMPNANILFIGGLLVFVSFEEWNLHKRIALKALLLIGTKKQKLVNITSLLHHLFTYQNRYFILNSMHNILCWFIVPMLFYWCPIMALIQLWYWPEPQPFCIGHDHYA